MPNMRDGPGVTAVVLRAPAKVNLFLELLARRPDGFHELETLMVAVTLVDTLAMKLAPHDVTLTCTDPNLSCGPDNLVVKAAEKLRHRTGCTAGVEIHLTKEIPMEAGLAGGSSDAATTLVGLNRLWNLNLPHSELSSMAAEIGSDVAFFLQPPAAWCTGRGEIVEPIKLPWALHFVLVCPPFGLSTRQVYGAVEVSDSPVSSELMRKAMMSGDAEQIGQRLFNRLESPAVSLSPEIQEILEQLRQLQPAGCRMSGSGSTMFALARDRSDAERIADSLRRTIPSERRMRVYVVRSCV